MSMYSYDPIDVGFDLRLHRDMTVAVPADVTEIQYRLRCGATDDPQVRQVRDAAHAVRLLRRAGYRAEVAP
jgi:hypothetical protein